MVKMDERCMDIVAGTRRDHLPLAVSDSTAKFAAALAIRKSRALAEQRKKDRDVHHHKYVHVHCDKSDKSRGSCRELPIRSC